VFIITFREYLRCLTHIIFLTVSIYLRSRALNFDSALSFRPAILILRTNPRSIFLVNLGYRCHRIYPNHSIARGIRFGRGGIPSIDIFGD